MENVNVKKTNDVEQVRQISKGQKAAVLVRTLSVETAKGVISYLSPEEQQILVREMARMDAYETDVTMAVALEYLTFFKERNINTMADGIEHVKVLFGEMPEKELEKILNSIYQDIDNPFEFLNYRNDIESILHILNGETVQTIATVVSHIKPKIAAEILQALPEDKMIETVLAITKTEQYDNEILVKMGTMLENKLMSVSMSGSNNKADGIKSIVSILNNVQRSSEKVILDKIDVIDSELSKKIRENLLTFDDLVKLQDVYLQKIVAETEIGELAKALKLAKEEFKEKVMKNISQNRREQLTEELDVMGPVRLIEAEKAQQTITGIAKRLETEGKIQIVRGEEDDVII